ncbi:GNAT family N-acetyltransferase [Polaribacter sp. IC073]|uniref:GNAT family N-acetyltransferase n=1 Tax=Polaribacter sp. IC073 TaxID=2508540 RepID=UPI0011BFD0E5|nr:GNAT family N-acetyltransferase [Polaribacter sp. IC073]TXD48293.1 GNAT family N-acetyltransferase [Polaribacter sp. IC073]
MVITTFDAYTRLSFLYIDKITNFLHQHLEKCEDDKSAIRKSLLYAAKEIPSLGGYAFVVEDKGTIVGATIINKTGMSEYQSENLLAYLVVHKEFRNKGIATKLLNEAIDYCNGNITLHINRKNDAIELFEKNGFESKKIQMTLHKK